MHFTDAYKHTKSTKGEVIIHTAVIGFSLVSVLVHTCPLGRVPGISFLVL